MVDFGIVLAYFAVIFTIGLWARADSAADPEEYFLSSRSLRWPSIAISTIATNIEAGHFLSGAGAAYGDGLALANFELNAIFGIIVVRGCSGGVPDRFWQPRRRPGPDFPLFLLHFRSPLA